MELRTPSPVSPGEDARLSIGVLMGGQTMQHIKFNSLSYLQRLLAQIKLLFRRKPEPEDPYAYRAAPLRRPPHGRSGAAVAELDEE